MKELIIIEKQDERQISYVEDGILKEQYKEKNEKKRLEGNVYAGKVVNVVDGMQAAFVDIGENKNAFLHIKEVLPKKSNITGNKEEKLQKYKIKDYIKNGQTVLVQVKRDCESAKGARVSTNIQIAGRFVILLPENNFITISQKIENEEERERLKKLVEKIKENKKIGVIVRTASENINEKELKKDFINTLEKLKKIQEEFNRVSKENKPAIIQENDTILEKILVDLVDSKLDKIYVNNERLKNQIENIIKDIYGDIPIKIECQTQNLETRYDLDDQIEKLQNRKVWLKCGGFLVIDKTEALTVIDVNSGKFTGKREIEKTIFKVNKEASIEIAKQIRLRDIGGIIVVDYINMQEEENKQEIIKILEKELKKDRAKTQIMQFTKLNLLEMTRKHMFSS